MQVMQVLQVWKDLHNTTNLIAAITSVVIVVPFDRRWNRQSPIATVTSVVEVWSEYSTPAVLKNKSCHSYIVGGSGNHVHLITNIHPSIAPAFLIKDIKIASHKMILGNRNIFTHFPGWQVGYGLFTYHISSKGNLIRYVGNQREHHQVFSFKEELEALLTEHSVDYIEDYLIT